MVLTKKQQEALLLVFKDYTTAYNANSISKRLDITPSGALKILKQLKQQNLLVSKTYGRAVIYKANLDDHYTRQILETALIEEARAKATRWLNECEPLTTFAKTIILFGSTARGEKTAKDIDLLFVVKENKIELLKKGITDKNKILLKPIHPIFQTDRELKENLHEKNPVLINALKAGYILYGQEAMVEVLHDVTRI